MRRIAVVIGGVSLYAALAISPVPRAIARDQPEVAAFFRPPLFNFSAHYEDGHVLTFHIGATRAELLRALVEHHSATGMLAAECGRDPGGRPLTVAGSYVSPSASAEVRALLGRDVVCLHTGEGSVLIFTMNQNHIRSIELRVVGTELP